MARATIGPRVRIDAKATRLVAQLEEKSNLHTRTFSL